MLCTGWIWTGAEQHNSVGRIFYTFLQKWLVAQSKSDRHCMAVIWHCYRSISLAIWHETKKSYAGTLESERAEPRCSKRDSNERPTEDRMVVLPLSRRVDDAVHDSHNHGRTSRRAHRRTSQAHQNGARCDPERASEVSSLCFGRCRCFDGLGKTERRPGRCRFPG